LIILIIISTKRREMKLYREVECSVRLPESGTWCITDVGTIEYDDEGDWGFIDSDSKWVECSPEWWLEPIEITEGEIEDIIVENSGDWGYINATDRLCHDINPVQLAKAITNLLKGET
jgi:hypothetical protein